MLEQAAEANFLGLSVEVIQFRLGANISGPHLHRIDEVHQLVQEASAVRDSAALRKLSRMGLKLRNFSVVDIGETGAVDAVFLQSTA